MQHDGQLSSHRCQAHDRGSHVKADARVGLAQSFDATAWCRPGRNRDEGVSFAM